MCLPGRQSSLTNPGWVLRMTSVYPSPQLWPLLSSVPKCSVLLCYHTPFPTPIPAPIIKEKEKSPTACPTAMHELDTKLWESLARSRAGREIGNGALGGQTPGSRTSSAPSSLCDYQQDSPSSQRTLQLWLSKIQRSHISLLRWVKAK